MMVVITLAVSRLVPMLFFYAAILTIGRFLYDRYRAWNKKIAKIIFGSILVVGIICLLPYMTRSFALVAAEFNVYSNSWEKVDHYYSLYRRLGGRPSFSSMQNWATALMNLKAWANAEAVLLSNVKISKGMVHIPQENLYSIGICRYYQNKLESAEKVFLSISDAQGFILRDYLLARIMERKRNDVEAMKYYSLSIKSNPGFFPSIYQYVRLLLKNKDHHRAEIILSKYHPPQSANNMPRLVQLKQAILKRQYDVPEVEFTFKQFAH